jgi:hypothetical protein
MMPKVTFELEHEQLDAIVLQELKKCYEQLVWDWENNVAVYDTRDELFNALTAFERVLEYFMVHTDFDSYMASFPLRQRD